MTRSWMSFPSTRNTFLFALSISTFLTTLSILPNWDDVEIKSVSQLLRANYDDQLVDRHCHHWLSSRLWRAAKYILSFTTTYFLIFCLTKKERWLYIKSISKSESNLLKSKPDFLTARERERWEVPRLVAAREIIWSECAVKCEATSSAGGEGAIISS